MSLENKKRSIKRKMVKTKIRTTCFIKRIPALAKTSGDGGLRDPDPEQRNPDPEQKNPDP